MNAITTTKGSGGGGLIPANVAEAMDLARMMADCGMLPEQFRGKPGNALMVVEQAMRWGLSPFSVAMEVSFIQGKPMYSGKVMAGALNAAPGVMQGRLHYDYSGSGDDRSVRVVGMLRGEAEPREVTVRLRDARTQNKVWNTQPDQQLAYHGARVWGRRHAPEVMLGAWAPEEFDGPAERPEPREVQSTVMRPTPPAQTMDETLRGDDIPDFDAPPPIPRSRKAANRIKQLLSEATDQESYNKVLQNEGVRVEWDRIKEREPEIAAELEAARTEVLDRIAAAYDGEPA